MSQSDSKKRGGGRWVAVMVSVLVLLAAVGGGAAIINGSGAPAVSTGLTYTAQHEPITISVTESGTIEARNRVVVKSEVEGSATIIYLIPEGTIVEEGELLIELDASAYRDELAEEQMELQDAEAGLVSARENLAVAENQAQADIAEAELAYEFAQQDLEKYRADEGEYQMQLNEAEAKIALAQAEMEQARQRLEGSRQLFAKQYISETELESDSLSFQRATLDLQLARQEKQLLETYTYQRQVAQLESDVEQARLALERAKRKARADIAQAKAQLNARQANVNRERQGVARLERQIANCTIKAPTGGMVVYAPQGNRRDPEVLDEGMSVRERQELIYLPTAEAMSAEVSIHESALTKIEVGQSVRIRVDALPNATFTGRVRKIAIMAEDGGWRNPDLKQYSTQIDINEVSQALRPGMTCTAEIFVAHYSEALAVPLQTVLRVDGKPTVFVVGPDGQPQARSVEIGMDNNRKVHVVSGLESGERVLLDPPLDRAEREAYGIPEDADVETTETAETDSDAEKTADQDGQAERATEANQNLVRMLRGIERFQASGRLDRLGLSDAQLNELTNALQQLEKGEVPELSDALQNTLRSKMRAAARQRQSGAAQARNTGGSGGNRGE